MIKAILRWMLLRTMAGWFVTQYVRLAWLTGRWTVHGPQMQEAKWDAKEPFILAFWHGRIMMMPKSWRTGVPIHMLISQHRDGELITRAVKPFGIATIRGSTARPNQTGEKGGLAALMSILRLLKKGECIGITPDGPRGPRMRASDGVVTIARLSGVPIIPATWSARHRWALNSWDCFLVPRLFTKGVIVWGSPVSVPRDADAMQLDAIRLQLETEMIALADQADELAGSKAIAPALTQDSAP